MEKSECYILGKITKTHALKGEATIFLDVDIPENYKKVKTIYLDLNHQLQAFPVERIRITGKKSIIKLEGIDSIEDAEKIVNTEVYLPLSSLPRLKGKQFYYHDVIGFDVFDRNENRTIGSLRAIYESTGQDLFAVDADQKEILIPIVDSFIEQISFNDKRIELSLPEGLLDVYLNS